MTKASVEFTASELETLEAFIWETVETRRDVVTRSDLRGVASGSVFNVLKEWHPALSLKVRSREGLVSIAERLGFSVNSGLGGRGLRGTGTWEFIDLPKEAKQPRQKPTIVGAVSPRSPAVSHAGENSDKLPSGPAVVSIIGWHGDEPPDAIVARKAKDIAEAGQTLWAFQSWKARPGAVQDFGRIHPGLMVFFIEGGATPTGTSQCASWMSEDQRNWVPLPKGIGPVTGKINGGTALVLESLEPCSASIDLWRFMEHPSSDPVRFMLGASTACLIPAVEIADGMKSRYRRVLAVGRLAKPYAVYLR
ncbi:hypothetical protein [Rhizobium ruizarguesonis]|uniref:hypothetical protein n=1 Tax=Rhizobium ruizarguesonis TaxID=2081791 RepID=UPI00102FCCE7|nr:hypothetical protein [Rhizobium ruizarguesonis]TBB32469.1 hypothetical protein ELH47_11270 [Rhizobium ruizarguesonis]TBE77253.1 hypothetical protein ELH01_08350 [Rhizobium ruizarguesonis]